MDKIEEILEAYKRLPAPDQYKVAEKILNIEDESTNGFDTQNMRLELNEVCHNRETCNYCPIKDEFGIVDCDFEEMTDKKIVEMEEITETVNVLPAISDETIFPRTFLPFHDLASSLSRSFLSP